MQQPSAVIKCPWCPSRRRTERAEELLASGSPFARAVLCRLSTECELQNLLDTVCGLTGKGPDKSLPAA